MSLFGNYNTPGRGVLKTQHEKKGFFKFWEVYGRHMWKLMELNIIYLICCIPIITFGPATVAMTKVVRNFSQERPAFVVHDFFDAFKKNFKQGMIMGIVDVIFILAFIVGIPMYKFWAEQNSIIYIPYAICLACVILFVMMHFYIYLMICSTNLNMKQILKNSLYLVSLGLKESLWTLLASFIVVATMYLFFPYTVFIIPFWPLTFVSMVICFNCYPIIRKHVIQPYYDQRGEENPEFSYMKSNADDLVFEDRAEQEVPRNEDKNSKRKGKTIS